MPASISTVGLSLTPAWPEESLRLRDALPRREQVAVTRRRQLNEIPSCQRAILGRRGSRSASAQTTIDADSNRCRIMSASER